MATNWNQTFEGMIERTGRAFRQDAELAMGTDPTRAIVELVTNSDDAYVKLGGSRKGSIRIEVERRRKAPKVVVVRDRAGGMKWSEMRERLGTEASRTSGFESDLDVRGLLGRGAKDCAFFGEMTWESITADEISIWKLQPSGMCHGQSRPRTSRDKLRHVGTIAELQIEQRFTLKNHQQLKDALTRHYELRPCLLDRRGRDVRLIDLNQGREDHLVYEMPKGQVVGSETLDIPGYPGQTMEVRLFQATENLDDGSDREYWRHALLIRSGRAAYDVFAGKFEREPWSQYLGWFFGEVQIPAIRTLIKEYDDRLEAGQEPLTNNPVRLITRNRRGLIRPEEHPFVAAVTKQLEEFLRPHLERRKSEMESASDSPRLTDDTNRRLRELGRVLGRFFEEEEASILSGRGGNDSVGLEVIPSAQEIEPGATGRFSVRFKPDDSFEGGSDGPTANMRVSSGPGLVLPTEMVLIDRGTYFSRSFSVHNLPEGTMAEIEVRVGDDVATCILQCSRAEQPDPIDRLQFEHSSYRVREGNRRHMVLYAPWDVVADESAQLQVSIHGDPTISLVDWDANFAYDYRRGCGIALVTVQGRGVGTRARVTASLSEQTTVAELEVSGAGKSSGGIRIDLVDEPFPQRAIWSEDFSVLRISTQDRSLARYLGPHAKGWPGQSTLHFRTILAEIVAFHSARRVVEARFKGQNVPGLNSIYREHMQLEGKCLPRVHSVLVGAAELPTFPSSPEGDL